MGTCLNMVFTPHFAIVVKVFCSSGKLREVSLAITATRHL